MIPGGYGYLHLPFPVRLAASGYQPFPWRQRTTRPGTAGLGRPSSPAGAGLGRAGRSPPRGCAPWKLTLAGAGKRRPGAATIHPPRGLPGVPGSPEIAVQPTPSQALRGRGRAWRMTLAEKLPALRRRRGPGGGPAPLGAAACLGPGTAGSARFRAESPTCVHRRCVRAPLPSRSSRPRPPLRRSARASGCPAPGAGIPPPARAPPAREAPPPRRARPPRTCAAPPPPAPGVLAGEGTRPRGSCAACVRRSLAINRPPPLRPQQALGSICTAMCWGATPQVAHLPFRPAAAAPRSWLTQLVPALESWRLGLPSSQPGLSGTCASEVCAFAMKLPRETSPGFIVAQICENCGPRYRFSLPQAF